MSCYVVDYDGRSKVMRPVTSAEDYRKLRGSSRQEKTLEAVRRGDKRQKMKLLQMNYSCIPDDDGRLKGCKRASLSVGMDVDFGPDDPDHEAKTARLLHLAKDAEEREKLGLLMLERSATKGFHMVFVRHPEMTQEENLRWASSMLGVAYDEAAKDITRVFFTTGASDDDLLFLDERLFDNRASPSDIDAASDSVFGKGNVLDNASDKDNDSDKAKEEMSDSYDGIPYRRIVEALEDQLGGVPTHGSRNQFIFSMACQLRYVCNHNPHWVAAILPTYGESHERWMSTIRSACNRSQNQSMSRVLLRAIDMARATMLEEDDETLGYDGSGNGIAPPPMPRKLPPLIKLLVSKTPKIYQPAVAHAVFPALAAHLWKTRFRYIDNVEHEATLMNVLMAGTGAGKNCIAAPIDCIMKDIRQRDKLSLEKERLWKEEVQTKGANKDKKKRPEGLIIQEVDADMTNAAFVLRMAEAEEHFLYVRMNEIDQFDALKTSAKSKSQFQIMCLAFDPGNTYGQTRVGTQSVSARVCIRFNWNASTTIMKGQNYFKSVLTDGPISRINFCTIPEQPIGSPMPVYGSYDVDFESQLKPYIDHLNAARGLIECQQATRLAKTIMQENARFAELSQSRTYENLSFRANVIAFLKAMVLYVAHGEQWDKTMEDFIRWSEQYDLWCKMHFFGDAIAKADGSVEKTTKGPVNLLTELGDRFTTEDAILVRRKHNLSAERTANMLANWKSRKYIEPDTAKGSDFWKKAA